MKVVVDSSALVAALWSGHDRHRAANDWLVRIRDGDVEGSIAQIAVQEVYSILTSLPLSPPFHPHSVKTVLGEALWHLQLVPLDEADYVQLLEEATNLDYRGADASILLHVRAAQKASAEAILTATPQAYTADIRLRILPV